MAVDIKGYAKYLEMLYTDPVVLFSENDVDSGYVGTKKQWVAQGTIYGSVHPVDDKLSVEIYGDRIVNMRSIHCATGSGIKDGMGVAFDPSATKPTYRVISAKPRKTHLLVIAEVIGRGSKN